MKKVILWLLVSIVSISIVLTFTLVGCKVPVEEAAPAEEEVEEEAPAEEVEEVAEEEAEAKVWEIAYVVKLMGIPWFETTGVGLEAGSKKYNVNAYITGAADADPANQVTVVEDLITRGVDCICVMPNDPESLVPVLQKAMDKGILTLADSSPDQKNVSYAIEPIDNVKFGRTMLDNMVRYMGTDEGQYFIFIGGAAAITHILWADAIVEYAQEKYPKLELVTDYISTEESQETAYQKTLEMIKAYPELKGIIGLGSINSPGAAQALREKGLVGQIVNVGTVTPNHTEEYILDGSINEGTIWNPALIGEGVCYLAKFLLEGGVVEDGMEIPETDLPPIKLYENSRGEKKVMLIDGQISLTKDNVGDYDF